MTTQVIEETKASPLEAALDELNPDALTPKQALEAQTVRGLGT